MFKKFVFALTALIVGFTAFVAMRPSTYRVERSLTMATPVDLPFGLVNDFHRWHFWSPWDALDPKMKKTFDGAYAGPGATYAWSGNDQVGKGKMTILDAKPYDSIHIQLEFLEPWASTNTTLFTFQPVAEGIRVTWAMEGHNTFMGKAFSLFM
ncbi:MAG TPA: SRPBCC family protein, partial [Archangium sp.]|nr:SRPBCC family protein [Archangium sp.]